jgi:hypothetical protein
MHSDGLALTVAYRPKAARQILLESSLRCR